VPNKVAYSFVLNDRFSSVARRISAQARAIQASMRGVADAAGRASTKLRSAGAASRHFAAKAAVASTAILGLGILMVSQAAKFEQLEKAFQTLTQSAERGTRVFQDLKSFAAETPFQLEEIAKAGRTLLAFGIDADRVKETLGFLGDIAAGSGGDIEGLAQAFGKIRAKGKVTGEELNQLAERGINLREALAAKFGLNATQVEKAFRKGLVTFDLASELMQGMTKEGGRFFELMARQSKTTAGLFSTLKDSISFAGAEIGAVLIKELQLNEAMASMTKWIDGASKAFQGWAKANPTLLKVGLALGILFAVLAPLALAFGAFLTFLGFLAAGAAAIGATVGGVLAVGAAIAVVAAAGAVLVASWGQIKAAVTGAIGEISKKILMIQDAIVGFAGGSVGKAITFLGKVFVSERTQTDVNVNVNAPKGSIRSVNSVTTGRASGLNVGVNMAEQL
jgi:tape measure domain-containing protein